MKHSGCFRIIVIVILAVAMLFSRTDKSIATATATINMHKGTLANYEMYQLGSNEIVLGLSGKFMPLPNVLAYDENNNQAKSNPNEVKIILENTRLNKKNLMDYAIATPMVTDISLEQIDNNVVITMQTSEPLKLRIMRGEAPANEYMLRFISANLKKQEQQAIVSTAQQPLPVQSNPFDSTEKITLDLRDVELRDVLRMMSTYLKKNIIIDSSLPQDFVTMTLTEIPLNEFFSYLAKVYNLTWRTIGDNTVVIGAKSASFNLNLNREELRSFQLAYSDPTAVQGLLAKLANIAPDKITLDTRQRTLYVKATPEKFIEIANILQELDRPGSQVMIQAKIFEYTDGATKEVETAINAVYDHWWLNYSGTGGIRSGYAEDNQLSRNLKWRNENAQILPLHTDLETTLDGLWREFDIAFRAVENKNQGQTLANPSVITIDGQEARVSLTEDYPYIAERDEGGNPTWRHQEVGPTLTFTPQVGRDGMITLKLNITTGEVIEMMAGSTGETMPRTSKRTVNTTVRVQNGDLIVVGGLYRDNKTTGRVRVPVLGYIPLLGELFTYRNDIHRKTQVVMLVVPYILDVPDTPIKQKILVVQPN